VFIERKIQEKKFSKAYADLAAYQGWTVRAVFPGVFAGLSSCKAERDPCF